MSSLTERLAGFGFAPTQRKSRPSVTFIEEDSPEKQSRISSKPDGAASSIETPVAVVVRCRPSLKSGTPTFSLTAEGGPDKVSLKLQGQDSAKQYAATSSRTFRCSRYCGPSDRQEDLFESAAPIVERTMEGYNGTIFCYGVTGSGKTFTMSGPPEDIHSSQRDPDSVGIVQRVSKKIFECIRDRSSNGEVYSVEASFLEIYSSDGSREQLIDLLADEEAHLEVKQDPNNRHAFVCDGLRRVGIRTPDEMCEVLKQGQQRSTFMETSANCYSSRSHCIFMLSVECLFEQNGVGDPIVQRGKLLLVDLAGSESLKNVQALTDENEELRRKQAIGINRVLSSLATVVSNVNKGLSLGHRDSALTMLLRDCLGGNSRALLVATIGPEADALEETGKTLTFAQQMMSVKNAVTVNRIEPDKSALMQLRQRHADCIRIMEDKTTEEKVEEAEELKKVKQEVDDLNAKLLTKETAEQTLETMRSEQIEKIDELKNEMQQAMAKELEKMRQQSIQDLDTLRQSVEKHVSHSDNQHEHAEEHEAHLSKMQAELQDAAKSQRAIEEESAELRVRLAAAEERSKMLQLRQEDLRKERLNVDEERKNLRQQSEQQWQKLTSMEGETQKFKAEAEAWRAEVARMNSLRAEEDEQLRIDKEMWRVREAELQTELTGLNRKLEDARRESEVAALRIETERREVAQQLRLQIERLEAEARAQSDQLITARQAREKLEASREDVKQREEVMRQQGAFELKQCQDELDEATQREKELMQMLHEIQEGIISASGPS